MNINNKKHRSILQNIARRVMVERGFYPDFSAAALAELKRIPGPARADGKAVRDMRDRLWASIDNDDSLDLDQLTAAEAASGDAVRLFVAIADVVALVKDGSAIDEHARYNTTSVFTAAEIFPMLPEDLSTGLTSLNLNEDRLAVVVEMVIGGDGLLQSSDIYRGLVHNHAKLAYNSVASWLEGNQPAPQGVTAVKGLAENLLLQDQAAQRMKQFRQSQGALSLDTDEAKTIFDGDNILDIEIQKKNRAREFIEDMMIAANVVTVRFLSSRNVPSIRRVVSSPKRWDRIVAIARENGAKLPDTPDPIALDQFLTAQKAADPDHFPDLSLAVIKLLGSGEYVAESPGNTTPDHFGLAVKDYTHSTAPNRRYTDLITQRLVKSALGGGKAPYNLEELGALARHCTEQEDDATKIERQVNKSAAALLLEQRIGEQFNGLVTGAADKGTWVRLLNMPVEGRIVRGFQGIDVGDRVRVELESVNVEMGYIDFKKVS